jgi:hypothetical protein
MDERVSESTLRTGSRKERENATHDEPLLSRGSSVGRGGSELDSGDDRSELLKVLEPELATGSGVHVGLTGSVGLVDEEGVLDAEGGVGLDVVGPVSDLLPSPKLWREKQKRCIRLGKGRLRKKRGERGTRGKARRRTMGTNSRLERASVGQGDQV